MLHALVSLSHDLGPTPTARLQCKVTSFSSLNDFSSRPSRLYPRVGSHRPPPLCCVAITGICSIHGLSLANLAQWHLGHLPVITSDVRIYEVIRAWSAWDRKYKDEEDVAHIPVRQQNNSSDLKSSTDFEQRESVNMRASIIILSFISAAMAMPSASPLFSTDELNAANVARSEGLELPANMVRERRSIGSPADALNSLKKRQDYCGAACDGTCCCNDCTVTDFGKFLNEAMTSPTYLIRNWLQYELWRLGVMGFV